MTFISSSAWLGYRLDLLCVLFISFVALVSPALRDGMKLHVLVLYFHSFLCNAGTLNIFFVHYEQITKHGFIFYFSIKCRCSWTHFVLCHHDIWCLPTVCQTECWSWKSCKSLPILLFYIDHQCYLQILLFWTLLLVKKLLKFSIRWWILVYIFSVRHTHCIGRTQL